MNFVLCFSVCRLLEHPRFWEARENTESVSVTENLLLDVIMVRIACLDGCLVLGSNRLFGRFSHPQPSYWFLSWVKVTYCGSAWVEYIGVSMHMGGITCVELGLLGTYGTMHV